MLGLANGWVNCLVLHGHQYAMCVINVCVAIYTGVSAHLVMSLSSQHAVMLPWLKFLLARVNDLAPRPLHKEPNPLIVCDLQ